MSPFERLTAVEHAPPRAVCSLVALALLVHEFLGKQRNGLLLTDGGGIKAVLTAMGLHSGRREVVKSGCHALAILSDIQGQGARIAGADGVKVRRTGQGPQ